MCCSLLFLLLLGGTFTKYCPEIGDAPSLTTISVAEAMELLEGRLLGVWDRCCYIVMTEFIS